MSYDLMVFDLEKAPREQTEFMQWYDQQTEWEEDHNYQEVSVCSERLKAWFMEMITFYPPMNGSLAPSDDEIDEWDENDDPRYSQVTDYSLGREVIYMAFAWSVADEAYAKCKALAEKHGVGFFNASGNPGEIMYYDLPA